MRKRKKLQIEGKSILTRHKNVFLTRLTLWNVRLCKMHVLYSKRKSRGNWDKRRREGHLGEFQPPITAHRAENGQPGQHTKEETAKAIGITQR